MALDLSLSTPPPLFLVHSSSHSFSSNSNRRRISTFHPTSLFQRFQSRVTCQSQYPTDPASFSRTVAASITSRRLSSKVPRSTDSSSSSSESSQDDSEASSKKDKVPFGYTRKDVLLIGLGVTVIGVGLKSGLEYVGVDTLQAGNVVQLVMVLGLTVGWIATYIFRVSNKDMTYVQQLRDYENKVMQKRLEGLTEAELEVLLEQVEEEKQRLASSKQVK